MAVGVLQCKCFGAVEEWEEEREVRREKSESARDSMVRVAEGEREAEKESDQGRRGKAEK